VTTAVWRAHRAIACAAKKDFDGADAEHRAFRIAMKEVPLEPGWGEYSTAMRFLLISELFIRGEIALQKGRFGEAIELLEEAAELEDGLGYGEPPLWLQPVRHTLGAALMEAGRPGEAEAVFRADLAKWPGNGWSLYGLHRALEEQGRASEAEAVLAEFRDAWAGADAPIESSCKCIPTL